MPPAASVSAASPLSSEAQSLDGLYRQHYGWLFGWLRKRLSCSDSAADLAQDTFARLLSTRAQLGLPQLQKPRAYLTTVAKGLVIDFYRRADLERAWLSELAALPEALHPSPEERFLVLETLEAIARMLDGLSAKARTAWLCSRLDGMTHAEIAEQLQVSVPRVRQYLAAAARHCYTLRFGVASA